MDKLDRAIALAMDAQNLAQECAVMLEGISRGAIDEKLSEGIALVRAGRVGAYLCDGLAVMSRERYEELAGRSQK